MPVYPSSVQLSTRQLRYATDVLRQHRSQLRTGRPRALSVAGQVVLTRARLRNNDTYTCLATGHSIGLATAHRAVRELVDLLAQLAPTLPEALQVAAAKAYTIIDGTVVLMNRVRAKPRGRDKEYYSGKVHHHGMNLHVIAGPRGEVLWVSPALPGAVHDVNAARRHDLPERLKVLAETDVDVLGDKGYVGAGGPIKAPYPPYYRRQGDSGQVMALSRGQKAANASHARMRAVGERANAQLKSWLNLAYLRDDPSRTTAIAAAVTVMIQHR